MPIDIRFPNKSGAVFGVVSTRSCMSGARLTCTMQPAAWGVKSEPPKGVRLPNSWEREMREPAPANMASGSLSGD